MENAPQTMLYIFVAGLKWPLLTTLLSLAWLASRSLFLYGYVYSGKAQGKGRFIGAAFWLVQGVLWGLSAFGVAKDLI